MMAFLFFVFAMVTLIASSYLSIACFSIIQRMSNVTPWSLAIPVIAIAALGAYGFLESVAYLAGAVPYITPLITAGTIIAAAALSMLPRIDTKGRRPRHGHI